MIIDTIENLEQYAALNPLFPKVVEYLKGVTFHYVENVQDVWNFALTDEIVDNPLKFEIAEEDDKKK